MERDTVVRLARPGSSITDDPLLLVLQDGARRMLQQVIEAEPAGPLHQLSRQILQIISFGEKRPIVTH